MLRKCWFIVLISICLADETFYNVENSLFDGNAELRILGEATNIPTEIPGGEAIDGPGG